LNPGSSDKLLLSLQILSRIFDQIGVYFLHLISCNSIYYIL